ncbi:MAG: zinc ribbon domain-containing protein [Deltaproteobacteria bacterium]|nr:zinc ribbon domain-containing protein [Deltaproteobacteria bacterium]
MSVETYTVPFFYSGPKVRRKEWGALAKTSFIKQAFMLFSVSKKVECDRIKREIRIKTRKWWFIVKHNSIPFLEIEYIDREQLEIPTSFGFVPGGYGRHDSLQSFIVCVVTIKRKEKIPLFEFWGEGSEQTGWFGVIFGDSVIDIHGGQEDASINFAKLVAEITETRFGVLKEVKIPAKENGKNVFCVKCGHQLAPNVSYCIYCGGTEIKEES